MKLFIFFALLCSQKVLASDINRQFIAELDPVAPTSSSYETTASNVETSKWGGGVDFNIGGNFSTGPEVWLGNFTAKSNSGDGSTYRREDMWPGERQKIDATRLRWTAGFWEQNQSMRGWYVKTGYSYTRILSRSNRYIEVGGVGDALPAGVQNVNPEDNLSIVTDTRHGLMAGFGNRWLFMNQRLSIGVGASLTANFRREVNVDSKDPNARKDYDRMIDDLPDAKIAVRPMPEINLGAGYAF